MDFTEGKNLEGCRVNVPYVINIRPKPYILVINGDIVYPTHWLHGHLVVGSKVVFGGGGVLVGHNSVGHGEKLLDFSPSLLRFTLVVTQPNHQPGEEVCSHTTKSTVCVVCVWMGGCCSWVPLNRVICTYFPPCSKVVFKNCILAV